MSHKVIELSPAEFQDMLLEIKNLETLVDELRNANRFLNDEIRRYNKLQDNQEDKNEKAITG